MGYNLLKFSMSLESNVPEVPSFFSLLSKIFDSSPFIAFLHQWETIVYSLLIGVALSLAFYLGARKRALIPDSFQNFLELVVEKLRGFIVEILGPEGDKFVPFIGTLFLYILCMNWMAIIPFMKPPTSNLSVTIALALCVFCLVQYLNIRTWGFFGFFYHMAGSPKTILEWFLVPIMFPIELLTQITRPLTLAFRLFGNIVGEDIMIGAAAAFGVYLLSSLHIVGGLPTQIPFMLLALLTGLMQALVFALLSTVYILLSLHNVDEKNG